MNLLHKEHPHSFPEAAIRRLSLDGNIEIKGGLKPDALTRNELKMLYNECGEVLHKGTISKASASFVNQQHDYQVIMDWQKKIVDLMNEHMIGRKAVKGFYLVALKTKSGFPSCSVFTFSVDGGIHVHTYDLNATKGKVVS